MGVNNYSSVYGVLYKSFIIIFPLGFKKKITMKKHIKVKKIFLFYIDSLSLILYFIEFF